MFERAIVAAGSLVLSADRVGLTTRFVTGGVDLRGPDVGAHALQVLSPIQLGPSLGELERDPGEGLGLVIVVTSSPAADAWRRTERISDPTLTRVGRVHRTRSAPAAGWPSTPRRSTRLPRRLAPRSRSDAAGRATPTAVRGTNL